MHGAKYEEIEKRGSEEAHWNKYGWERQRIAGVMCQTWRADVHNPWMERKLYPCYLFLKYKYVLKKPSQWKRDSPWLIVLCAEIAIHETLALGVFAQDLAFFFFFQSSCTFIEFRKTRWADSGMILKISYVTNFPR